MEELYAEVARRIARGEAVATATIIRTRGSTPREVGAKMLVTSTGLVGTVGGGCGEAEAHRAALDAIADGRTRIVEVDLTEEISYDARGVCGGVMEILIQPWRDEAAAGVANRIVMALAGSGRIGVVTAIEWIDGQIVTRHSIVRAEDATDGVEAELPLAEIRAALAAGEPRMVGARTTAGEAPREVFVEVRVPPPTLLICGAGHIAVPLAAVGKTLGFRVVVLDDRAEFANAERFPEADEIIAEDFGRALKDRRLDADTYVVLITRGHSHDVDCLLPIADRPLAYVGMIGSKRRVFAVHKLLHDLGVPAESRRRIHAPIGIDIAARTPAEIAVAIAAEIVRVKNGGGTPLLSDGLRDRYVEIVARGGDLE